MKHIFSILITLSALLVSVSSMAQTIIDLPEMIIVIKSNETVIDLPEMIVDAGITMTDETRAWVEADPIETELQSSREAVDLACKISPIDGSFLCDSNWLENEIRYHTCTQKDLLAWDMCVGEKLQEVATEILLSGKDFDGDETILSNPYLPSEFQAELERLSRQ